MGINEFHNPGMIQSPGDGAEMKDQSTMILSVCCDCKEQGPCCDFSENEDCPKWKEDGSCWVSLDEEDKE